MDESVLFVGTGGGNDVFSTLLAMDALSDTLAWKTAAIAGVLSPFHRHTLAATGIDGLFHTTAQSQRFMLARGYAQPVGFIDARVSELVEREHPYRTHGVYGLSLKDGSAGLARTFQALAAIYSTIVLVDVGGDIFYRGLVDTHVLSPMFDAIVLRAFIDSGVSGYLFEAGPGTDGELEPAALQAAFSAAQAETFTLAPDTLRRWETFYRTWIEAVRTGRTVPITIQAYRSEASYLRLPYRARAHFGALRRYAYFEQTISTELCRSYHLVRRPALINNPSAIACASPREWFERTQAEGRTTNNEANLEYFEEDGKLWQFLSPSPLFPAHERDELIDLVLHAHLETPRCDGFWMLRHDWECHAARWSERFEATVSGTLIKLHR